MPAPKGNEYWKLRAKHGRDKLLASPDLLWESACEYFQYITDNPIETKETKAKPNGKEVTTIEHRRPFTWEGLELFLDIDTLRNYKTAESHKDFLQVITRIEKVIYSNKFEGATSGIFNANIIARDLGLRDRSDMTTNDKEIQGVIIVQDNKTKEIIEKM